MGKTLTEMISDLKVDLKDPGTLWSERELSRCIERAVADLSRFLPREMVYELTCDPTVTDEPFTTLSAESATAYVNAASLQYAKEDDLLTIAGQPDQPRPCKLLLTDADESITVLTVEIKGVDEHNNPVSELFVLSSYHEEVAGWVQTGKQYFKHIDSIRVVAIEGAGAADTLSIGKGEPAGVWIALANHPIRSGSETVTDTGATITYTRDTDYQMDYFNGRICLKSLTTMVASSLHAVSYTKSRLSFDMSVLPSFQRAHRVEYPVGVPQSFSSQTMWGNVLSLEGGAEGQSEVAEKSHVVVQYYASHVPPTKSAPGSYPELLDSTVELAAGAYALFLKALQYEHQAATDLAAAQTSLGNLSAIHTLTTAALAAGDSDLDLAVLAADITKVATALDAIPGVVGTVAVPLALKYLTDTGATDVAAKRYLADGDAYLLTVNAADQVPQKYSDYARASIDIAQGHVKLAESYLNEAVARIRQLEHYGVVGKAWVELANSYIYQMDRYLAEAEKYFASVQQDQALAERFRAEAVERRNEAWAVWRDPQSYIGNFSLTAVQQSATTRV